MIKSNELRLGNLIQSTDPLGKMGIWAITGIETIGKGWVTCGPTAFSTNRIEGIPLTAEWLERMGFEMMEEGKFQDDGNWHLNLSDEKGILAYDERWQNGKTDCFSYNGCTLWHRIENVHQLQNLYFALTGQELTIKPGKP